MVVTSVAKTESHNIYSVIRTLGREAQIPLKAWIFFRLLCNSSNWQTQLRARFLLGSIRNKNSWNNANKRSFGYSHSGILGFHFESKIAGIYSKNIFLSRIDPKRTRPTRIIASLYILYSQFIYDSSMFFIVHSTSLSWEHIASNVCASQFSC